MQDSVLTEFIPFTCTSAVLCLVTQSCPTLCNPMDCSSVSCPHQFPLSLGFSSKNTGVDCHALLQGTFPAYGSNPGLLHCRWLLYHSSHQGSPRILSGAKFCFLIVYILNSLLITRSGRCGRWLLLALPPYPSSSTITVSGGSGWHLLDHRHCVPFWEPSFTFGGPESLMAVTFLAQGYGRKYCMCIQKKAGNSLKGAVLLRVFPPNATSSASPIQFEVDSD